MKEQSRRPDASSTWGDTWHIVQDPEPDRCFSPLPMSDTTISPADALNAARDAAWTGRHAEAIALCTEALNSPSLDLSTEIDLLDVRAESHHAMGDLASAMEDVNLMTEYAYGEESPALIAQALNRKCMVQMRRGELSDAVKTAELGFQAARASEMKHLVATSLLRLGEAYARVSQTQHSLPVFRQAAEIFAELGDISGQGRAVKYIFSSMKQLGDVQDARLYFDQALALLERAGDQYGLGNLLNSAALFLDQDLAERLALLSQAQDAFDFTGYVDRQAMVISNMGQIFHELGLYARARRLLRAALAKNVEIGADSGVINVIAVLVFIEIRSHNFEAARDWLDRLARYLPRTEDPVIHCSYYLELGLLTLYEQGNEAGIKHLRDTLAIAEKSNLVPFQIFANMWLGHACLELNKPQQALAATSSATEELEKRASEKMPLVVPSHLWWIHARALAANDRADDSHAALEDAYGFLLARIANVRDVGYRRNLLNKNDFERQLVRAWVEHGEAIGLPQEKQLAHLTIETDPRQPFQRLANSGLRLNTLRTIGKISEFLVEEATELSGGERVLLILEEDRKQRIAHHLVPHGEDPNAILEAQAVRLDTARRTRAAQLDTPENPTDIDALSHIVAPLIAQNELLGYLYIDMAALYGVFDETDRDMMGMLANQGAVALQNARWTETLEQRVRERTSELETINKIGEGLLANRDLEGIADVVGEYVRQRFGAESIVITLTEDEGQTIHAPYIYVDGERLSPVRMPMGQSISSVLIQQNAPLLIRSAAELQQYPHIVPDELEAAAFDALSWLGVPLRRGNMAIGALAVVEWRDYAYDESHVRLLSTIAANMGVALENARLLEETRRRARETAALAEVGRDIAATLDLSTVLERIANHARELLEATDSAVFLPDASGAQLRGSIALGPIANEVLSLSIQPGQGVLGDLWQRQAAELINDAANDPRAITISGAEVPAERRMMAAPLLAGRRAAGMMAVWRTGRPFKPADLAFFENLSRQAAIALENARLFEEAQAARRAAEEASRTKSAFLANMSHELRTPLNAIIGFTRIVRRKGKEALPEKQLANLEKVLVSSDHLLGLINSVLDIAKIEAGRMEVHPQTFAFGPLADQMMSTTKPLVKPGVELKEDLPADLPQLHTDQEKLKQILLNLLSNAAKFTHEGTVTLRARIEGEMLHVDVADTGIGMAPDAVDRIFEEFQQADSSTTRQYGGTGLGLSISQGLARLLGGDLSAVSEEGRGSTFTLTIPITYRETDPSETVTPATNTGQIEATGQPLILAIDDDPHVHDLLRENLGEHGYRVVAARSGDEGLQLARELAPLAITLDIMMPEKDGWQVLHELKADPATRDIPVILLTIVDRQALGYQLGAADYLVKPLEEQVLLSTLRRLAAQTAAQPPLRLLVVDDDPNIPELIRQLLDGAAYQVSAAADGQAALDTIEREPPDLILLDLLMPGLDGFGVIEALRRQGTKIPIVVLTARRLTAGDLALLQERVEKVMQKNGLDREPLLAELRGALAGARGGTADG